MKTFTIQQQFNLLKAGFPSSTLGGTMLPKVKAALLGVAEDSVTRKTKTRTVKSAQVKTKARKKSSYTGTKTTTVVYPAMELSALAIAKGKELLKAMGRKTCGTLITLQAEILCLDAKEIECSIAFTENKGGNLSAIRQAWVALKEAVSL